MECDGDLVLLEHDGFGATGVALGEGQNGSVFRGGADAEGKKGLDGVVEGILEAGRVVAVPEELLSGDAEDGGVGLPDLKAWDELLDTGRLVEEVVNEDGDVLERDRVGLHLSLLLLLVHCLPDSLRNRLPRLLQGPLEDVDVHMELLGELRSGMLHLGIVLSEVERLEKG